MKILPRYKKILERKTKARFLLIKKSGLDEKIRYASKILTCCEFCERKCGVNRKKGEKGICKVGNKILISSYFDHWGEEYFFIPSFTVFFWSCTFSCQFCQNWSISQRFEPPQTLTEQELAKIIDLHAYCKNVNLVGGDPTPQLGFILKTLKHVNSNLPVIWNSNFYMSEKSMDLLKNIIDVYLSDFKYGNNKCALRLSKVQNYWDVVKRNHLLAFKDSELVIRHLILPSHFDCCTKPILDFIAENFKNKVILNLMDQYRPCYKADKYPEINRILTLEEFNKAVNYAKDLGLNFIT